MTQTRLPRQEWVRSLLRPTIARKVVLGILATGAATGLAAGLMLHGMSELKVHGPVYAAIKQGNDLVADILPPPLYVVEAYLTLHQMLEARDATQVAALRDRLVRLRQDFEERRAYWERQPLPDELRNQLDQEVLPSGEAFFSEAQSRLLPPLAASDRPAAAAALQLLEASYARHRAAVDTLVERASRTLATTEEEATSSEQATTWLVAALLLAQVLAVLGLGVALIRGISQPVRRMAAGMEALAAGDLAIAIPSLGRRDELGEAAAAIAVFRDSMLTNRRMAAEQEAERGAAEAAKRAALRNMADAIEREAGVAIARVSALTAEMTRMAGDVAATSGRSGSRAGEAAHAADVALATAETVAAAAEELTASIREVTRRMTGAAAATRQAVASGHTTRAQIDALAQRAEEIGAVVEMIADVAARTNLLALNATIEAARAGEAGKGFAVVASEVKQLALQTARSTEEITRKLAAIQAATREAAGSVRGIVTAIAEIEGMSAVMLDVIQQQGAATDEIARSVVETATSARQVSHYTAAVSEEAGHVIGQAGAVQGASQSLDTAVRELGSGVIRIVRTATKDVDRRSEDRVACDIPGRITLSDGTAAVVRVVDLASGGARIVGAEALQPGTQIRLGMGSRMLVAEVLGHADGGSCRLRFKPGTLAAKEVMRLSARTA